MAQDYDSPRNKDEDEESLQALGKGSQNTSNDMDDDENAIAEDYELPGADLSNEDASVTVIPMQGDEFICSRVLPGEASQPACLHVPRTASRCVRSAPPDGVRRGLQRAGKHRGSGQESLDPGHPAQLHYAHAGDAGADLRHHRRSDAEAVPSGHWCPPAWPSPCLRATWRWCIRVPGWPSSRASRCSTRREPSTPGTVARSRCRLINLDPEAHRRRSIRATASLSWSFSATSRLRFIPAETLPGSDRAERGFGSTGVAS